MRPTLSFFLTTMMMYERSKIGCITLKKRFPTFPNPLLSLEDILFVLGTISFLRIQVLPSKSSDDEVGEQPVSILDAFYMDRDMRSTLNTGLLDYLAGGIDPSIVLDDGILGTRVIRSTLEARQNKAEGEVGLAHFYYSTLFEAVNRFIWLDEARNHRWVTYGVSRRAWRAMDTSAGGPPAIKFVVDGFTRVVFHARPLPDEVLQDICFLPNERNALAYRVINHELSAMDQVSFDISLHCFHFAKISYPDADSYDQ